MELPSDIQKNDIKYLLSSAVEKRGLLFQNPETDCFRIFNSAGDGIDGLTIDFYAGYILLQFFNSNTKEMIGKIPPLLPGVVPVQIKGILCKNRMTPSGDELPEDLWKSVILEGDYPADGVVVVQNGIKARLDLINGQNTGIFLDMREIRDQLARFYRSEPVKRMLNLFCYTALFSAHALKNGVESAVNVDLSKGVLNRAKVNYQLNGLKIDQRDFIYGDAVEWTRRFYKNGTMFDFAIFDPPTFARNRKKNFSVKKDYSDSLQQLELVINEGFVLTSINSYTVTEKEYRSFHPDRWELLMFGNESSDFVNGGNPYLKVGLWKI